MKDFGRFPFMRLTFSLAVGISINLFLFYNKDCNYPILWLSIGSILAISLFFLKRLNAWSQIFSGIALLLAFGLAGFTLSNVHTVSKSKDFAFNGNDTTIQFYKIRLDDEISEKQNSWRATCSLLEGIDTSQRKVSLSGKLLVYWPKRSNTVKPNLQYGDHILVSNKVLQIPSAAFPEDFDFRAVMRYKNVQHQIFLKELSWVKKGRSPAPLIQFAILCKNKLVNQLHQIFDKKTAGLLASLIVGYRDELDPDDIASFSKTGTMHVLAVSGMHAGLLYLLLLIIFTGKKQSQKLKVWQSITIIILLWLFALITGLTASVIRAAIMFTIVEAGRSLFLKKGNLINSLFAAGFVQLAISPHSLIDTGFQLSYLAVLGIAILYPWLSALWMPPTFIFGIIYQSALLSISATVATLPISLYYFKSFPIWFIPANIFIVPISTFMILSGLLSAALHVIPLLGSLLVLITKSLTTLLLFISHFFADLPLSTINRIHIDSWDAILLLLFLCFIVGFGMFKHRRHLWLSFLFVLFLISKSATEHWLLGRQREIIVSEIRGKLYLVRRVGYHIDVYSNPISQSKVDTVYGFMKNYCQKNHVSHIRWTMDLEKTEQSHGLGISARNRNLLVNTSNSNYLVAMNPLSIESWPKNYANIAMMRDKKVIKEPQTGFSFLQNNYLYLK